MGLWWAVLAGTVGLTAPALAARLLGVRLGSAPLEALLYGLGVFGAAFLLAWAAEAAQKEISRGLALAALVLVAVLPEYSVDLYFAWRAAHNPEYVGYVAANMTGANRILIGVGWPLVVLLYWWRTGDREVPFQSGQRVASSFLALAAMAGVRSRRQIIPLLREGVLGQRSDAGGDRPRQPRRSAGSPTR